MLPTVAAPPAPPRRVKLGFTMRYRDAAGTWHRAGPGTVTIPEHAVRALGIIDGHGDLLPTFRPDPEPATRAPYVPPRVEAPSPEAVATLEAERAATAPAAAAPTDPAAPPAFEEGVVVFDPPAEPTASDEPSGGAHAPARGRRGR